MNEYLLSVIGTILFSSVLIALLPDGKTNGIIKNVSKLVCLLTILSPILNIVNQNHLKTEDKKNSWQNCTQSVIEMDMEYIKYYSELRIANTEQALALELLEKYDVETVVYLQWELQNEDSEHLYSIEKIRITRLEVEFQKEYDEERKQNVRAYLTKNYCSEVKIE